MTVELTRRRFLGGLGATCAVGAVGPMLRPELAFAADGIADHTLVVLVLAGGLDGISALVPAGDADYGRQRNATRLDPASVLAIDSTFGLHPALAPIHALFSDGLAAAIPAVGSTTATRSHFSELATMAAGASAAASDGTGWLTRHLLTAAGGAAPVLAGASVGTSPALELRGHAGAFNFPDLANVGLQSWTVSDRELAERSLAAAYAAADPQLATPAATAFEALARLHSVDLSIPTSTTAGLWERQLSQIGALIRAEIGMQAAVVSMSGWDTHQSQGSTDGRLATLLDRLARAIAGFVDQMADRLSQLTVVVVSEFGRRVHENGSGGTDHGRGGLALVLGGGLVGGVHGAWPGLAPDVLDEGDLPVATDLRSVLAEVVRGRLGNQAIDVVFPGFTPVPLGFA